jgi:hypothetical protein
MPIYRMKPAELAAQVYTREECSASFKSDLEAHLLNGYVHSTPTAFVMARPVDSLAETDLILNPWHSFPREEQDAWLIWLAAGDLASLLVLFPYSLPLIGWQKRNNLRFHPFDSALAKLRKRGEK